MRPSIPTSPDKIVILLTVLTFLNNLSLQIFLPAMPAIQVTFGATAGETQLLISLSFVVFGLAMLIYGPLSDIFGRRTVFLFGFSIYTIGNFASVLAPTLWLLIIARVVAAAGASVGMTLSRAVVRDVFPRDRTAGVVAKISMVAVLSPIAAPLIGGALTEFMGWRTLFVFLTVTGIASVFIVLLWLPETLRRSSRSVPLSIILSGSLRLLTSRSFRTYALQGTFAMAAFFAFMTAAPFVYIQVLGLSHSEYGLYYMTTIIGFLAGYFIAAKLSASVGMNRMIVIGTILAFAAACICVLNVVAGLWTPIALTAPVVAMAIATGIATPNSQAGVIGGDLRTVGAASGLAGFLQMMFGAVVVQAVGILHDGTPYPMVILMLGSSSLALLTIVWGFRSFLKDTPNTSL